MKQKVLDAIRDMVASPMSKEALIEALQEIEDDCAMRRDALENE